MGFGPTEIIIFLVIVMLLFGRRIPETMFSLGKGITEFKKGMKEDPEKDSHEPRSSTHVEDR